MEKDLTDKKENFKDTNILKDIYFFQIYFKFVLMTS